MARWGELGVVLVLATVSGCGYVLHGSKQHVAIDTAPTGARVEVDGIAHTAPVELDLLRRDHHTVVAHPASGPPVTQYIYSEWKLQYQAVDLFTLPIIGNMIDGITGGDSELNPTQLTIPLSR